jgi:hypothetical protein
MSYGLTLPRLIETAVDFGDKVLQGARAIDLKAAKAMGLKIPPSVLVRASHVIE